MENMKEAALALIGAGEIAQNFHLPAIKTINNIRLLAITDVIVSKAHSIAEKFDIPLVCDNVDELLAIDDLDGVIIAASTDAHKDIALQAIAAGKAVFIEKPAARTLSEVIEIASVAKASKAKVMIGMNQRFRYDAMMIKNYVQMGEIGKIFYIKSGWMQQRRWHRWRESAEYAGGGVLIDLGIALIDSILWFFDFQKVRSVRAQTFHHRVKDVEDVCVGSIYFENGSVATLETSWSLFSSRTSFYCNVHGSLGSAQVNPLKLNKNTGGIFEPNENVEQPSNYKLLKKSFETELRHFANAILGFAPIHSTADEAVETMRVIDAMYKSAASGKETEL